MRALGANDPTRVGGYRLLGRLGEGGMGTVYLGRSPGGRTVALKLVQEDLAQVPEFRARFAREVAAARKVGGEWTAGVLDGDTDAEVPWVATQYVPGPSLHEVVGADYGPLPERSVRVLARRLAQALQAIHRAGLVHRDLKPANVLVTVDGPRVIDFGIARALDALADAEDGLRTRTGMVIGSPAYMSPEQVRGSELTCASDVFSLGSVLAFAASGRSPFGAPGSGVHAQLFRVAEEEPDLADVPEALLDLVRACLAKDPALRPGPEQVASWAGAPPGDSWLPAAVLTRLGRRAAELLDYELPRESGSPEPQPGEEPAPRPAPPGRPAAAPDAVTEPQPLPVPAEPADPDAVPTRYAHPSPPTVAPQLTAATAAGAGKAPRRRMRTVALVAVAVGVVAALLSLQPWKGNDEDGGGSASGAYSRLSGEWKGVLRGAELSDEDPFVRVSVHEQGDGHAATFTVLTSTGLCVSRSPVESGAAKDPNAPDADRRLDLGEGRLVEDLRPGRSDRCWTAPPGRLVVQADKRVLWAGPDDHRIALDPHTDEPPTGLVGSWEVSDSEDFQGFDDLARLQVYRDSAAARSSSAMSDDPDDLAPVRLTYEQDGLACPYRARPFMLYENAREFLVLEPPRLESGPEAGDCESLLRPMVVAAKDEVVEIETLRAHRGDKSYQFRTLTARDQ